MTTLHIHPILLELGLRLPMAVDTEWTLAPLDDAPSRPRCRLTFTDALELYVESRDQDDAVLRVGFDEKGRLISVSHTRHLCGAPFDTLRQVLIEQIMRACHAAS